MWVRILTLKCAVCGRHGLMNNSTHTLHISECFGNGKNRWYLFTPDLRLFKPNTAREKGISAIVRHNTEGPQISDW